MSDDYGRIFEEQDDATELAEDEKEGLIPSYISTRGELNQAEQQNIVQGELWAFAKKRNPLDLAFLDTLHKKCMARSGSGQALIAGRPAISVSMLTAFPWN